MTRTPLRGIEIMTLKDHNHQYLEAHLILMYLILIGLEMNGIQDHATIHHLCRIISTPLCNFFKNIYRHCFKDIFLQRSKRIELH